MSEQSTETLQPLPLSPESAPYFFASVPLEYSNIPTDEIDRLLKVAQAEGYPIPENPALSVQKTLETFNLQVYPSEIPPINEYIASRIAPSLYNFPGYNYGVFVQTPQQVAFAKVCYGPENTEKKHDENGNLVKIRVGGLEREAKVLRTLSDHGYDVPKVLGYEPAYPRNAAPNEAETLETLYTEAFVPEEGTSLPPEYWNPQLAHIAAEKIKTFNTPVKNIELFQDETLDLPLDIVLERAEITEDDDYAQAVEETIRAYAHLDEPIVVHADAWQKNIIVKRDSSDIMFVDWELAGAGYKGQDAARTLWGLTLDKDWQFTEVTDAAEAFTQAWCETDDDVNTLKFGVVFESLRWIIDRKDRIRDEDLDEATELSILALIDDVKHHTLKVLHTISK